VGAFPAGRTLARRALLAFGVGAFAACGGGGGGGGGGDEDVLTPNSVDFEVDGAAAGRSFQVVEIVFDDEDCEVAEGAVLSSGRRRLLRFDTVVVNRGELDCVVGDPASPTPPLDPEAFEFHDCHGHYHLEGWASYELRHPDDTLAAVGHKQSFCITDSIRVVPGRPSQGFDCSFQGLSSGWADVYDRTVPGQWVDVSGLPGGDYVLVITVNPEGGIPEVDDRRSNVARIDLVLPPPSAQVADLDDHSDVAAQATRMPTPAGFQARIQTAGDLDWFRFRAAAGVDYVVSTTLLGLLDSRLRVFEADGTTPIGENDDVVPGSDFSSRVDVPAGLERDVTIEVSGPGAGTGTYRLQVAPAP
jgi:hypothetical protein